MNSYLAIDTHAYTFPYSWVIDGKRQAGFRDLTEIFKVKPTLTINPHKEPAKFPGRYKIIPLPEDNPLQYLRRTYPELFI